MSDRIEIKQDGSWVFHGEDSRLRDPEKNAVPNCRVWNPLTQQHEYKTMYRVYCMNCGADGGLSSQSAVWVKYMCDDCFGKGCPEWFIPMLPDEEIRWRMGLKEATE